MPDFNTLLKGSVGEARRPPVLPPDTYPGRVRGTEFGESRTNRTPFLRVFVNLSDWGPSVPDTWEQMDNTTGKLYTVAKSDVDLSRRQLRRDYFLTEDAMYRFDEFLASCGLAGVEREEAVAQLPGMTIQATVIQELNQQSNEFFNSVSKLTGEH